MAKHSLWAGVALICLTAVSYYAASVAKADLTAATRFLIWFGTLVLAGAMLAALVSFSWVALERARQSAEKRREAKALRLKTEREAQMVVTVAPPGHQVFVHETTAQVSHKPLHLAAGWVNGLETMPGLEEVQRWALFHLAHTSPQPGPRLDSPPPLALDPGHSPPAKLPELVRWFDLLPSQRGDLSRLVMGVRQEVTGQIVPVTVSLYKLFHTIIAASSGWGKSVFVNAILAQLATCAQPVEFVLIDQQEHGLAAFKQCDRLRYPLLREPGEILTALREVYEEAVRRRSELFARYDADDLAEYNQRAAQFLPPIIVAVDEASALLAGDREVGAELKRQAWELRKFGVYQILCLTSAKGTTIDTDHRQQFASKIQMHANDRHQARLLLDAPEATTFPAGRAIIDLPGQPPTEVQTPYITKAEVRSLLRPADSLPKPPGSPPEAAAKPVEVNKDDLFKSLVEAGQSRNQAAIKAYGRSYAGDLVIRAKRVLGEI